MGALFLAIMLLLVAAWFFHFIWLILAVLGVALGAGGAAYWWRNQPTTAEPVPEGPAEDMFNGYRLGVSLLPETGANGEILPALPFQPKIAWNHFVVGGVPDSGKSNTVSLLLAKLAPRADVQFIAIDPKGGMEFWPWEPRLALFADTSAAWSQVLQRLVGEMDNRMATLKALGLTKFRPSVLMPWIMLIIDEAAEVFILDKTKTASDNVARVRSIMSRGRALGIIVVLATQKPDDQSIPTSIRDVAAVRIAHQTTTYQMTDTILGQGWRNRLSKARLTIMDPQYFDQTPGKATVITRGQVDLVQMDHFPEGQAAVIAQQYAHLTRRDLL